jgi:peroxiredoxin
MLAAAAAVLLHAPADSAMQQTPAESSLPDVQKLGPQVGSRVPEFTLVDQRGQSRTLASLMGPHGVMLVFFRSADWWPYCKTQLVELQGRLEELKRQGFGVAGLSYDSTAVLSDFSRRRGITFPLLSDPGSITIKKYGILNTTVPESNRQVYGVPFPGTFMLNTRGIVTSRFFEQAYQERNTVSSIMARLGNHIDVHATTISSPQLELTSYATDDTVAPGTQFSVVVDVRPATTGRSRAVRAVPAKRGLLFQAAQRTRTGVSAVVPCRAGSRDRFLVSGSGGTENRDRADN